MFEGLRNWFRDGMETLRSVISEEGQDSFDKFSTVDWVADTNKARNRSQRKNLDWPILKLYEASQAWVVVLLVGVAIGTSAAFIDISAGWLSDTKMGYCSQGWYLNRKFCCWEMEDQFGDCKAWVSWGALMGKPFGLVVDWSMYLIISMTLAVSSAFLVTTMSPTAAGSGIAQIKTILGGFLLPDFLGKSTLIIKMFGLILAVSSGLSLGKEGPSVHLACCIGDMISKLFGKFRNNQAKNREILSASSAAGVAVAFGSPIGGVLYSLEELSTHFPMKTLWRSFFSALVATVILHAFNPFRTGQVVLFQVAADKEWKAFEILMFVFIGLFGGIYGVLTIKLNQLYTNFRTRYLKDYKIVEVAVLATLTACICYPNFFLRVDMSESMAILFKDCSEHRGYGLCVTDNYESIALDLLLAAFIRFLLVTVTYGSSVPTGIFIPSMAIGACFGRAVGILFKLLYTKYPTWALFSSCPNGSSCINPGTYAFLGAAAALCGITKMTVSVVVIMFELTGASEFILPTMITVFVTKAVGDAFYHGGIADQAIRWQGFPFLEPDSHQLSELPVAQVMAKSPVTIPCTGWKVDQLETMLKSNDYKIYPVIVGPRDSRIEGIITRSDILNLLSKAEKDGFLNRNPHCFFTPAAERDGGINPTSLDFGGLVDPNPFVVHPKLGLEAIQTLFRKIGPHLILVELHGHLVGLITKKELLRYFRAIEINEPTTHSSFPPAKPSIGWWQMFMKYFLDPPTNSYRGEPRRNNNEFEDRLDGESIRLGGL